MLNKNSFTASLYITVKRSHTHNRTGGNTMPHCALIINTLK